MNRWRAFTQVVLAALLLVFSNGLQAQEKTGAKEGFTLAPGTVRIVMMRPDISVGEQSTGGMFEANADWTSQARENLARELSSVQDRLGNTVINYDEQLRSSNPIVSQYSKLFGAVAGSVLEYQFFPGNRLPTKKRKGAAFDWTLGPGVGKIEGLRDADYLLFIYTHDAYGSTGRKLLQFAALFAGVAVKSGEHQGYAGLVDLKTGELVWLNADAEMGGDVRTAEGAQKRVKQLLEGFPGRPAEAGVEKAK